MGEGVLESSFLMSQKADTHQRVIIHAMKTWGMGYGVWGMGLGHGAWGMGHADFQRFRP